MRLQESEPLDTGSSHLRSSYKSPLFLKVYDVLGKILLYIQSHQLKVRARYASWGKREEEVASCNELIITIYNTSISPLNDVKVDPSLCLSRYLNSVFLVH